MYIHLHVSLYFMSISFSSLNRGHLPFSAAFLKPLGFQIPSPKHTLSHLSFVSQECVHSSLPRLVSCSSMKLEISSFSLSKHYTIFFIMSNIYFPKGRYVDCSSLTYATNKSKTLKLQYR